MESLYTAEHRLNESTKSGFEHSKYIYKKENWVGVVVVELGKEVLLSRELGNGKSENGGGGALEVDPS